MAENPNIIEQSLDNISKDIDTSEKDIELKLKKLWWKWALAFNAEKKVKFISECLDYIRPKIVSLLPEIDYILDKKQDLKVNENIKSKSRKLVSKLEFVEEKLKQMKDNWNQNDSKEAAEYYVAINERKNKFKSAIV